MALPRWKSTPDFVLASSKKGQGEARHDPKAQRERMNMFKRQLAANRTRGAEEVRRNRGATTTTTTTTTATAAGVAATQRGQDQPINSFVTRSMVEALREERVADGTLQKEEPEDSDAVHISAEDWPFVYFVVALDQMPAASGDVADYKVSKTHTAKERQRIMAARKRRIQQSREELERVRESTLDSGLRLEPLRHLARGTLPATPQTTPSTRRRRMLHTRHPTTPISSNSNRETTPQRGEFFLNPADQLTFEDLMCRGFSQWFSDTFSAASQSQPASRGAREAWEAASKPQDASLDQLRTDPTTTSGGLELPDILSEKIRQKAVDLLPHSAPGSMMPSPISSKKVHFGEGLPFIKGNSIIVMQGKGEAHRQSEADDPEGLPVTAESGQQEEKNVLQPPWSAPLTSRSMATLAPRSKMFKPMPIPKIDIVSEMYDELIIKAIQAFLEKEGYSRERFDSLRDTILSRLSTTYPRLARHRAWKLVRKDTADNGEGTQGAVAETDERSRMRLRPLHQGFFAAHSVSDASADFAKENDFAMNHLPQGSRQPTEHVRPRWVPVLPASRPYQAQSEGERCTNAMFMSVDGRHIVFTPRDDVRFKTPTLPGATSDYRMAPLVVHTDSKPVKTWTHIIPSGV